MNRKIILLLCALFVLVLSTGCQAVSDENAEFTRLEAALSSDTVMSAETQTFEIQTVAASGNPPVYFTADITAESLAEVYAALKWSPRGKLAVKVSTGEPPNSNYLRQELIGALVRSLNGTYVECNTAYGGSRAETAMHYHVAKDHGFTPVDIQDEDGSAELAVAGGEVLQGVNYVGAAFDDYDSYLVLSHFKGHGMAGFGGAVKNISIGMGSSKGKVWIHSGGTRTSGRISGDAALFQKAMAEAGLSVSDALGQGENIVYINVMNRLSVDCDCNGNPAEPDIHDIGILASRDPVALDKACLDLIWKAEGSENFKRRVENRSGFLSLEHGEKIGLGTRAYEMISLD